MLSWEARGGAWFGFDSEQRLIAQVVRYDQPTGWVAFLAGRRIGGPYDTATEAMAAAERAVTRPA
jgi:hypothetical protein